MKPLLPLDKYDSDEEDDWTLKKKVLIKLPVLHLQDHKEVIKKLNEERDINLARGAALVKCRIVRDRVKGINMPLRCP